MTEPSRADHAGGAAALPSALDRLAEITRDAGGRRLAVFLDYDGTLTPIVERPEDARLSPGMRERLSRLAEVTPLGVLSGRDLADVRSLVALGSLFYGGSHGFEIAGPGGLHQVYEPARPFLPELDRAEGELRSRLAAIAGAQVERKRFAIAIHYRRVRPEEHARVAAAVEEAAAAHPRLRRTGGKMVFELRPALPWHKGTALGWMISAMGLEPARTRPVYVGDDLTDEDAFEAIRETGAGIVVGAPERPTAARYRLADTSEVGSLLERLAEQLRARLAKGSGEA